jgi:outer membrane protein TolC
LQQYRLSLVDRKIETGREIAREQLRGKRQEIVDSVKKTYYAALQTQSALESVEQSLKLYQELDRVTDRYVVQQVALKADSLQVKTRVQEIIYESMTLRDRLADQKETLNNLLGRDIRTEFQIRAVPELTRYEADLTAAREQALAQRPEIKEAQLKIKAAEYDRRIKKYWRRLRLHGKRQGAATEHRPRGFPAQVGAFRLGTQEKRDGRDG